MLLYPTQSPLLGKSQKVNLQQVEAQRQAEVRKQVAERMLQKATTQDSGENPLLKAAVEKLKEAFIKSKKKKSTSAKLITRTIGRREYPALVEMKIAGRSPEEIARALNAPESSVRMHLSAAMGQYRSGELEIRGDRAQSEAGEVGAEKSVEFFEDSGVRVGNEAAITILTGGSTNISVLA